MRGISPPDGGGALVGRVEGGIPVRENHLSRDVEVGELIDN